MASDWLMKENKGLVPMPQYGTTLRVIQAPELPVTSAGVPKPQKYRSVSPSAQPCLPHDLIDLSPEYNWSKLSA